MEKYVLEIEGVLEIDVEHDEFLKQFTEWLESKRWTFGGVTKPYHED